MPRKKRLIILVVSVILVTLIILLAIFSFLYLKTDIFKSKQALFTKYLLQNFDAIEIMKNEDNSDIKNLLNNNKYISEMEGKIEYTENIGTSDENKKNPINDVRIKIKSNVDKIENYSYRDIAIKTDDEDLVKLEYLTNNETNAIRLNGIQQFVSVENNQENQIIQQLQIEEIEKLISNIDITSAFDFTEKEKQTLKNTYLEIVESNVSKDKFSKQSKSLITVNNKDVQTNAYCMKITIEEYNNLCIKILEQLSKDEIILAKIDFIENKIKEKNSNYKQNESFRENFLNIINSKIEEIQNNNIGNDEVKVTVYENEGKLVRTSIEKLTNKLIIDLYNGSSIKINNIELSENTNEQFIKIEKNSSQTQSDILIEYEKMQNNEILNDIQLKYSKDFKNEQLNMILELEILNQKYRGVFNILNNVKIIQEFDNRVTLDVDNIKLNDLSQEQIEVINTILNENIQGQLSNLNSKVNLQEYVKMLKNLDIINGNIVQLPSEGEVTEVERKRFNSQFEFFVSENLTTDNIKDLLKVTENNFKDMKILLKNGEIQDLDVQKIESNQEFTNYIKDIDEILIVVQENSSNQSKQEDTLKFIDKNINSKYNVSIQYDENGLTQLIRIKIKEK